MPAMNPFRFALPVALLLSLPATKAARAEPAASACERANFRVIVDVGHSAESPGAISARGVTEFEFNLKLAQTVEKTLRDAGFAKTVLLVSTGKSKPSMYQRVARVNEMTADLLLSIHHDAVPKSFLEKWEYDGKPRVYSDRFKGHSIFVSEENVERKSSLMFGEMLGEQLKARGMAYTPHYTESFMGKFQRTLLDAFSGVYRYDTLWLLKKSQMPAVLLEAGSIINRDEEVLMTSLERQSLVSAAVKDAVETFCLAMVRPNTVLVAKTHAPQQTSQARPRKHRRIAEAPREPEFVQPTLPSY
jgi:N-acetylmuramoyl-L-alanine amidase